MEPKELEHQVPLPAEDNLPTHKLVQMEPSGFLAVITMVTLLQSFFFSLSLIKMNLKITGLRNDLWRYDTSTNIWTWMHGSNNINQYGKHFEK
jgi:hypothetical protein